MGMTRKRFGLATARRFGNLRYGRLGSLRYDEGSPVDALGLIPRHTNRS